jgi:hypothetical protein
MHRILRSNLTPEDWATYSKWVRVVAAYYGCVALLLLLAAITLAGPSQPSGPAALVAIPHRLGPPDAAVRSAAQQRAWRSGPTDSSAEARVGLDAQNR